MKTSGDVLLPEEQRTCTICCETKATGYFYHRRGKLYRQCKPCVRKQHERWRLRNPDGLKTSYKKWYDRKRGHAMFHGARDRARRRGIPFTITKQDVQRMVDVGTCAMTGIPFDLTAPAAWNAPSLDQIKPGAGYTPDNARVVLYSLNVMMNTWGPERIIQVADALKARALNVPFVA